MFSPSSSSSYFSRRFAYYCGRHLKCLIVVDVDIVVNTITSSHHHLNSGRESFSEYIIYDNYCCVTSVIYKQFFEDDLARIIINNMLLGTSAIGHSRV